MPVGTSDSVRPYSGMFGPPRNVLLAKWDLLFEKDPKEWIAFKPALGLHVYPCYACRHMFYSKRSFQYHMNRRTVVLVYSCKECPEENLTFYNRCAFLVHARKHFGLHEGKINLNDLEIHSLPFGLAGFTKDPDIPFLYDVEEEYNVTDIFVNSQFYAARYEDRGKEIISLTPSNLVINKTSLSNGEAQALSVLQIAKNIPKCQFILLDHLNRLRRLARVSEEMEYQVKSEPEDEQSSNEVTNTLESQDLSELTMPIITNIESVKEESNDEILEQEGSTKENSSAGKHLQCPECNQYLETSLETHFSAENRPASMKFKCFECRMICSSQCSYLAHVRFHRKCAPFICPDCGQQFPDITSIESHMDTVCFHNSKSVRYRCPKSKCSKVFASPYSYSQHFTLHMDVFYKCTYCELMFDDEPKAVKHKANYKDDENEHSIVKLYTCSVCNDFDAFDARQSFDEVGCQDHIEWHMSDVSKCIYIFVCKYCTSYFRTAAYYATHIQKCASQNKPAKRVVKKKQGDKTFLPSKYETGKCKRCANRIIYAKEKPVELCGKCLFAGYKKRRSREPKESNISYDIQSDEQVSGDLESIGNDSNNAEDDSTENPEEAKKKSPQKENFERSPQARIVVRPHSKGNVEKVVCILCKQHMLLSERKSHQSRCRYSRPEVFVERFDVSQLDDSMSMIIPPNSDLDSSSGSRYSLDNSPSKSKRRRLVRPKRTVLEVEPDLTAEKPIEFDGTYVCHLCDFKESKRDEFHSHVKSHRQLSTAYQCMECGECFVVKRSLIIHLQHFHNIHDYKTYFQENDCFDVAAVEELAKNVQMPPYVHNDVKVNQCNVCLEQFESSEAHDKHFRVHGMAFILQKNRQV